jgi:hypothetical protein
MAGVRFPAGTKDFSELLSIPTVFAGSPSLLSNGHRDSSPGIKRLGHEADNSPPSSAETKNGEAITPLPHASSWRGA